MNICSALTLLLVLAAPVGAVGDGAEGDVKPLHFRIETACGEERLILGRIEASEEGGRSYDRSVLDLDGDGIPEKTIAIERESRGGGAGRFDISLRYELDGRKWMLNLRGSVSDPFRGTVVMDWSVLGSNMNTFFINGLAAVFPTIEEARAGKAIRLGPPFHFEAGAAVRGPDALVHVGLKDANGSTLRIASRAGSEPGQSSMSQINLLLLSDGKAGTSVDAEYG